MRKRCYIFLTAIIILAVGCIYIFSNHIDNIGVCSAFNNSTQTRTTSNQEETILFQDDFQSGRLSKSSWKMARKNDFRESSISVVGSVESGKDNFRLCLLADTMSTMDDTVKYHGLRLTQKIDLSEGKIISFDLDWNDQANGCYLTAGVYLCPTLTNTTPSDEPDWIKFEYVGVPTGRNARLQILEQTRGILRFLFDEGWPHEQRTGREIKKVRVKILIDQASVKLLENEEELFSATELNLGYANSYLYLEMSSHSNYPARTVYFDNIKIERSRK